MKYANDKILTIATAFMTNEPKLRGDNRNLHLTIPKTQYLYEVWSTGDFMMNIDEVSKNAIVLTANEPKLRGNNRNFPKCNQISALLYPMREIDKILIMAKVFANTFNHL